MRGLAYADDQAGGRVERAALDQGQAAAARIRANTLV